MDPPVITATLPFSCVTLTVYNQCVPQLLAIFPLDLVLLPGVTLPLHIFEPRYKEMIGECMANKKAFGVVRAKPDEGIAELGCTAEITQVTKRYEDGRLDIVTIGQRRFEIVELNRERSFLQAEVMFVDDEEGVSPPQDRKRALELYTQVTEITGTTATVDSNVPLLSFQLAGTLPIDLDFKQALLGIRSESERLGGLIEFFEAILPQLKKAVRKREKAGGNGHVP